MTQRQFEGRSAAEAAIKACEVLGLTRSALRYEMVSETGEKLTRRVVISVDVAALPKPTPPEPVREPSRPPSAAGVSRSPGSPAVADSTTREGNFAQSHESNMPARRNRIPERVGRGDRRSRGGARTERYVPRGDRGHAAEAAGAEHHERERATTGNRGRRHEGRNEGRSGEGRSSELRPGSRTGGRERNRGRSRERPAVGTSPHTHPRRPDGNGIEALLSMEAANIAVVRRAAIEPTGARSVHALHVTGNLLQLMSMDLQPTLVGEDDTEMHIDLVGSDEARIIGRKGEVLLALQFVVNRIMSRGEVEGEQVVVLDAGGYRARRRVALQDLATKLASRALEERKAVRLSPMSAHDRRIFHMTLKEIKGVVTRSEGEGLYRNLLIIPAEFC